MVSGNAIDNSMKWRAEIEQKKYDRQIRILDKIIEIPQAEHRIATAEFYLSTNTFTGQYKEELEISLKMARELLAKQMEDKKREKILQEQVASNSQPRSLVLAPSGFPNIFAEPLPEHSEPLPEPAPVPVIEDIDLPPIGPKTIFSYDQTVR